MRRFFLATTTKPWSSTAPPADFRPYVDASSTMTEFSWRAVILGSLFGILFGAVSVYVGLRAGLTVSASIPISVLSISILRAFGRSTILENNIVQTTGSAGESVAAGVIFTLPALIFMGFSLNTEYWRGFFFSAFGGGGRGRFLIPPPPPHAVPKTLAPPLFLRSGGPPGLLAAAKGGARARGPVLG